MGLLDDQCAPQEVVPIGVQFDRIRRRDVNHIDRFRLVYMGHLREGQGLELIFESLPDIFRMWPSVSLVVVGAGPLEHKLRAMAEELSCQSRVQFTGFVEDHRVLEELLSQGGVGLALYEPTRDSFTWYADPSKPKQYMACGLPIIITKVPAISQLVRSQEAGIVIEYSKPAFISALRYLFEDFATYSILRGNAIQLASRYDWNAIFADALAKLGNLNNATNQRLVGQALR
jgi:glycosyltransferase involved in cell wall biosynthesis